MIIVEAENDEELMEEDQEDHLDVEEFPADDPVTFREILEIEKIQTVEEIQTVDGNEDVEEFQANEEVPVVLNEKKKQIQLAMKLRSMNRKV